MVSERKKRTKLTEHDDILNSFPFIKIETRDGSSPPEQHEISVLDINDSGMGISCLSQLKVGQQVYFTHNQLDWDLPQSGVIMWTFKAMDGFRAGIKFL